MFAHPLASLRRVRDVPWRAVTYRTCLDTLGRSPLAQRLERHALAASQSPLPPTPPANVSRDSWSKVLGYRTLSRSTETGRE